VWNILIVSITVVWNILIISITVVWNILIVSITVVWNILIVSITVVWNIFHAKKNPTGYDIKCISAFMYKLPFIFFFFLWNLIFKKTQISNLNFTVRKLHLL
jgi:hypothetical protein